MPLNRVILIDDSAIDNELHRRAIERSGLAGEIVSFTHADEALAYFRLPGALPLELLFIDINMPLMDGFELLDAAIAEFGETFEASSAVMLSTSMDPYDQNRVDDYRVLRDYCVKPLTTERFTEIVARLDAAKPEVSAA